MNKRFWVNVIEREGERWGIQMRERTTIVWLRDIAATHKRREGNCVWRRRRRVTFFKINVVVFASIKTGLCWLLWSEMKKKKEKEWVGILEVCVCVCGDHFSKEGRRLKLCVSQSHQQKEHSPSRALCLIWRIFNTRNDRNDNPLPPFYLLYLHFIQYYMHAYNECLSKATWWRWLIFFEL